MKRIKKRRIPAICKPVAIPGMIYFDKATGKLVVKRITQQEYEQAVKYIKEKAAS